MASFSEILKETLRRPVEAALRVYLSTLPAHDFSPARVRRILVFAYHGLGNFIMYTPALRLLRDRYPAARIDLQVGNNTGCEEVLDGAGFFDHIYNLPYSSGVRAWLKRLAEVRAIRYDVTINEFHSHSWRLGLLIALGAVPFRVGHVTSPGWSHRFSRFSFAFNIPVIMREDEHESERYRDLVRALGAGDPESEPPPPLIHLEPADRSFAKRFLSDEMMEGRTIVGVQPGTSPTMRWKQWPPERYRQLISDLIADRPDSRLVLFGSAGEAGMIKELAAGFEKNVRVAAGRTSVKEAAAIIERCNLLVCNDSGLMHVAVAVGTPVVAIYGPTDFRRTAPLGERHKVIRHELPCSPCFKLEGDASVQSCSHHDCLMTITPAEVLGAVRGLLEERN
jgi:lipopolysaccharide heptosyltransferase II